MLNTRSHAIRAVQRQFRHPLPTNSAEVTVIHHTPQSEKNISAYMTEISPSKLTFVSGDLFDAPSNSILVHACNTRGSWGGGIAVAFKQRFPSAFDAYKQHCQVHGDDLLGSCFLVAAEDGSGRMVACLFTSKQYGKNKDSPASILAATETAVKGLVQKNVEGRPLHACRFNSGKFAVPWGDTQKVLEKLEVEMTIYEPKDG